MAELFNIVSLFLEGLLNIFNLAVGILLTWSIFGIPILFYLVTFDFLYTLLFIVGIIKEDDELENDFGSFVFRKVNDPEGEEITADELDEVIEAAIQRVVDRKGGIEGPDEKRLRAKILKQYGIVNER